MFQTNRLLRSAAILSLAVLALTAASARQWNPDSRGSALDYTQILHSKGTGQVVVVWWVVPETFIGAPNAQSIQDVLSRYVVIGIAEGRAGPGAPMSFSQIQDLKISDSSARQLSPLAANATPAEVAQTIATLQGLARQNLGPIGQGMRWFVFDGSTIHSCQPGKLSVPYAGATHTHTRPIPGCAKP